MDRILKDQTSATLRTIPVYMTSSTTGLPVSSLTFSGSEIQVNKNGAGWVNALGTLPEDGGAGSGAGNYTYLVTLLDTNTEGSLKLKVTKTGCNPYVFETTIYTDTAVSITVRDAIMNYSHDAGLTIRGAFRRLDALIAGKATGLKGALARFFMRDGVTSASAATQDVGAGTRAVADVSGSES